MLDNYYKIVALLFTIIVNLILLFPLHSTNIYQTIMGSLVGRIIFYSFIVFLIGYDFVLGIFAITVTTLLVFLKKNGYNNHVMDVMDVMEGFDSTMNSHDKGEPIPFETTNNGLGQVSVPSKNSNSKTVTKTNMQPTMKQINNTNQFNKSSKTLLTTKKSNNNPAPSESITSSKKENFSTFS